MCTSETIYQALIHGCLLDFVAHDALIQVLYAAAQVVAQSEEGVEDGVDAIHGVFWSLRRGCENVREVDEE